MKEALQTTLILVVWIVFWLGGTRDGNQFFALIAWHPDMGNHPNRGWRMLVNVFSNTTPPRVKTAEGVSIVGLALSLSFMAAIVVLAFVACAGLYFKSIAWSVAS